MEMECNDGRMRKKEEKKKKITRKRKWVYGLANKQKDTLQCKMKTIKKSGKRKKT